MAVIKVIEIMASSEKGWEDATQVGLKKVSSSIQNIKSAYVKEHSVSTDGDGNIQNYRVTLKISFEVQ